MVVTATAGTIRVHDVDRTKNYSWTQGRAQALIVLVAEQLGRSEQARRCLQLSQAGFQAVLRRAKLGGRDFGKSVYPAAARAIISNPVIEIQFTQLLVPQMRGPVEAVDIAAQAFEKRLKRAIDRHTDGRALKLNPEEISTIVFVSNFFVSIAEAGILSGAYVDQVRALRERFLGIAPKIRTHLGRHGAIECSAVAP